MNMRKTSRWVSEKVEMNCDMGSSGTAPASSDFSWSDIAAFILLLSIGFLSTRSKFYGFWLVAVLLLVYLKSGLRMRFNFTTLALGCLLLGGAVWMAYDKIVIYYVDGMMNSREMWSRRFVDAENQAIRESGKTPEELGEAEVRKLKWEARQKVKVSDLSAPAPGKYNFLLVSEHDGSPVLVGSYQDGQVTMRNFDEVKDLLKK